MEVVETIVEEKAKCKWEKHKRIDERESPTGATCQLAIDVRVGLPKREGKKL